MHNVILHCLHFRYVHLYKYKFFFFQEKKNPLLFLCRNNKEVREYFSFLSCMRWSPTGYKWDVCRENRCCVGSFNISRPHSLSMLHYLANYCVDLIFTFLRFSISSSLILWSTQSGIVLIINESNRNKNIFATGSKKFPFRCLSMLHSPTQEAQEMVIKSQKQSCQSPMLLLVPGFRKYRDT